MEKEKETGDGKLEKHESHWILSNNKVFVDSVVEQRRQGNRTNKAFTVVG